MKLKEQLGEEWYEVLKNEFYNHYMKVLYATLRKDRAFYKVYPKSKDVFKAYRTTPLSKVKVLILDQHPYSTANGLAFSCTESLEETPDSLQNIFKEVEDDIGFTMYYNPDLTRWAEQGVMLLNRVLTSREGNPGAHRGIGWEKFTDKTIEILCKQERPIVFMLWGRDAQSISYKIPSHHDIIMTPHPSSLSAWRGFFNSKCFSRANEYLIKNKQEPIDWLKDE